MGEDEYCYIVLDEHINRSVNPPDALEYLCDRWTDTLCDDYNVLYDDVVEFKSKQASVNKQLFDLKNR